MPDNIATPDTGRIYGHRPRGTILFQLSFSLTGNNPRGDARPILKWAANHEQVAVMEDWQDIHEQPCNLGMQDMYRTPFYTENRPFAICGKYNEETGLDLVGRPCCCEFCGQRDPFGQLCEVSQKLCTTVEDCIQRHHGVCKSSKKHKGVDKFYLFWFSAMSFFTIMPFVIPAIAMYAAEELVLGLAG
ncbi:hypothetical protein GUITHDRAFT_100046 [Guillardia theta CCMP2712]|uniref:Uncharacterized protein n=1 Tax=Guillardia theta (strain CCMP2712) TaxID=905079 RepID=L1K1S8_GUITC|nr:hypothetical protein GUITHDRAFT_100046 [Guillardia theta CCMP2712]EKX54572.1 hypothetical protein GUITHDRAFT_100046 [Guillardia theta CCMP2712]|eukprot:XP_005841552.1 hypothetical protein GUITHDRAFT_100046 [Guillardia theta CCMP2712]